MTHILFRCDASSLIGSGHIFRCRTLARELMRCGATITFLCRQQHGDLIELLSQDFEVLVLLEQKLLSCIGLEGRELYQAWLGCTQDQDATDCISAIIEAQITSVDWVVVDHYGLDATWEVQFLNHLRFGSNSKLLVIDDLADRVHVADLLLDQNFFGDIARNRYQSLVPEYCRQMLGPHYALLGNEYSQLHSLVPPRTDLRRLLIFYGGVDADNLTGRTLEALMHPALAHLSVDVVLGRQSLNRQVVIESIARRPHTTLHEPLPSLAGLIARADLAIGAGGATTWERACLKLPSLVVSTAANQVFFNEALNREGHLYLLGDSESVSVDLIQSKLLEIVADLSHLNTIPICIDGFGAERVALSVIGGRRDITLRLANSEDESLLFTWANDHQVRSHSFSPELIKLSDHRDWFHNQLKDPDSLIFIASIAGGCPIGQIRFERQPNPASCGCHQAKIDFSLDICARGNGWSLPLVHYGLDAMVARWGVQIDVVAEVLSHNFASNACFARADFVEDFQHLSSESSSIRLWRWQSPARFS